MRRLLCFLSSHFSPMKPFKNTSLYSRLALLTSVTLVVGYFVVYAAWTSIPDVTG